MRLTALALSLFSLAGCSSPDAPGSNEGPELASDPTDSTSSAEGALVIPVGEDPLPPAEVGPTQPWTGDLGGMVERRVIRAAVTLSLTNYFFDGATQQGITYEALQQFEQKLNETLNRGHLKVHVAIIPVARDQLIPALLSGRADLAAANLTITPERLELVDFSDPAATDVSEIVVTGPTAPPLATLDDLAGRTMHVRRSSSYFESLTSLNERLRSEGKQPVELNEVDEHLEDEDLLEMVSAGLFPMIVVDSHKAQFWQQILEEIELHPELAVRTGGEIGWAFRKDSPELAAAVNTFIRENRKGTLMGNLLFKRYLKNTTRVERATSAREVGKLSNLIGLFQTYGEQYDFDPLMLAALGYQESRLDQSVRSGAGAIGVMQLLKSTASDPNVGIPDIEQLESNIHAGSKYLRFLRERYFGDAPMSDIEKTLFTFASYNAGPARVRGLRAKAEAAGLDPNLWFDNVEVIASREIGRETVQYVANIYKYYVAYRLSRDRWEAREAARPLG